MKIAMIAIVLSFCGMTAQADTHTTTDAKTTYQDIKKTFGFVPEFLKLYPEEGITGAWEQLKAIDLNPNTAIPGKYKSLISLAVAAQVPCQFCTHWDTESAKVEGATKREIVEAVALAGETRHWSTWLNGLQIDEGKFRKEVAQVMKHLRDGANKKVVPTAIVVNSAQTAWADIEQTLGVVPEFLKTIPDYAIVGAWLDMKGIQLSNTAIPPKYKELAGIAVASQIPCTYCTYFHTEVAKFHGATENEIKEAVLLASCTRRWSTVFHGNQIAEATFKSDVKRIMTHFQKEMANTRRGVSSAELNP